MLHSKANEMDKTVRFAIVGALNTGVDIAIFSLFFYAFDASLIAANSIGYLSAVSNSFVFNKYWTFSETRRHGRIHYQFSLFLVLGLIGLGLSNGIVWSLASYVPEIIAKLLSVGVLFVWNFGTSRFIVFSR
jgi:putative flippase GtrA